MKKILAILLLCVSASWGIRATNPYINPATVAGLVSYLDTLEIQIDGLSGLRDRWYLTNNLDTESVPGYYLTRSTVPATPHTLSRTLSGATATTPIFLSTYVVVLPSIPTLPSGEWYVEIYSSMSAGAADICFVVYDGTGTAMNYNNIIGTTSLVRVNDVNTQLKDIEKKPYFIKNEPYAMKSQYISIALVAYENNTPNRIMYWSAGGSYDSTFSYPEIGVSQIKGGTGIAVTPENGIGEVTVSVSSLPFAAYAVYQSTDVTGDTCVSTCTVLINQDFTMTGWRIRGDVSGNCYVRVSSAAFNKPNGTIDGGVSANNTGRPNLVGVQSSSGTFASSVVIGGGGSITFTLLSADTLRGIFIEVFGTRLAR